MTFTTKLSPGDVAWTMHKNKVEPAEVLDISVRIHADKQSIVYGVKLSSEAEAISRSELYVFATKQELLASL